jgi:hypothetical protein
MRLPVGSSGDIRGPIPLATFAVCALTNDTSIITVGVFACPRSVGDGGGARGQTIETKERITFCVQRCLGAGKHPERRPFPGMKEEEGCVWFSSTFNLIPTYTATNGYLA